MKRLSVTAFLLLVLFLGTGKTASAQLETAVYTNFPDWVASAKANAGFQLSLKRHISLETNVKYLLDHSRDGGVYGDDYDIFASAGVRWWPWNSFTGLYIGSGAGYEKFFNGWGSIVEFHDDYMGAYLKAGYDLMVLRHLNLEAGLVGWGGAVTSTKNIGKGPEGEYGSETKGFLRLAEVTIALVYIF